MRQFWGPQYDFITSQASLRLYQTGRGGGKTFAHVWLARQFVKSYPGEVWVSTEPTYRMVADLLYPEFTRQFRAAGELGQFATWRASEHKFTLSHGGEIRLRSCEEPDKLRGQGIAGFGMDEAAFCPYAAFTNLAAALRPAFEGKRRKPLYDVPPWLPEYLAICTTTPMGLSWVHYTFTPGERPGWAPPYIGEQPKLVEVLGLPSVHYGSALDNPYLPDHSKAMLEAAHPPGTRGYQQEVLGQPAAWEGLVYDGFRYDRHVRRMPDDTHVVLASYGVDWGWRQNGVIIQLCLDANGVVWLTKEVVATERSVDWWASQAERLHREIPGTFYCDPESPGNIAAFQAAVPAAKANNEVRAGIAEVSSLLAANKLFVDPGCEHTIREFGLYCYQSTKEGMVKPDQIQKGNDHCLDALRYAAMGLHKPAAVFAQLL